MTFQRSLVCAAAGLAAAFVSSAVAQDAPPATPAPAAEASVSPTPKAPDLKLPDVLAEVNGEKITKPEVEKGLTQTLSQSGRSLGDLPAQAQEMSYYMMTEEMVTQKAVNAESSTIEVTDEEVKAEMAKIAEQMGGEDAMKQQIEQAGETMESATAQIKESIQQQKWLEKQTGGEIKATDEEAKAFYEGNTEQFQQPETVRASHILIAVPTGADEKVLAEKKKVAEDAKARVDKGEDFAKVATELSEDPGSKETGGDLNFFAKDRMVPEFAEAAFAMKKGDVSEPVKSQFGFHVIKVTDKKEAGKATFDESKVQIVEYLTAQKRREVVQKAVKEARGRAKVTMHIEKPALPMPSMDGAPEGAPAMDEEAPAATGEAAPSPTAAESSAGKKGETSM